MAPPQREDYNTVIRRLEKRVDELEQAQKSGTIFIRNSSTVPPSPAAGGLFYVQGGVLHYIGSSGTNSTVAPA